MGSPGVALPSPKPKQEKESSIEGAVRVSGDCSWPILWSRWTDILGNNFIHLFVILPSGTMGKFVQPSIVGDSSIQILYSWPSLMFDPARLYEGTPTQASSNHPKAMGLKDSGKLLKKSQSAVVVSRIIINLPAKIEDQFVSCNGQTGVPRFHRFKEDNNPYSTLVMTLGCMEKRGYRQTIFTEDDAFEYEEL